MNYETIQVHDKCKGQVTQIKMATPPANVLTARMMAEIDAHIDVAAKDGDKKLIVICGEGKHFSFGASVDEHTPDHVDAMLPAFHRLIGKILDCDLPTLAQVSGMCLGGSFELALACSFIWADETAKLGVPEIQLGVLPPVASVLLPLKCSDSLANDMILTGNTWKAPDLLDSGLVRRVVAPGELENEVEAYFHKEFEPKSASSLRMAHRGARMLIAETYRAFIAKMEGLYLRDLMATHDAVEGISAFIDKREPDWKNE